jgi:hypothetical protein
MAAQVPDVEAGEVGDFLRRRNPGDPVLQREGRKLEV